jgi:hypothetical protein
MYLLLCRELLCRQSIRFIIRDIQYGGTKRTFLLLATGHQGTLVCHQQMLLLPVL